MSKPIMHKHILINAKVNNPISSEQQAIDFLKNLVDKIGMNIVQGPFASYVDTPGNRGITAAVMIETSHIAFHIWDEKKPAMLQFDLYTCSTLDKDIVLEEINKEMGIDKIMWRLYDREDGFQLLEEGKE